MSGAGSSDVLGAPALQSLRPLRAAAAVRARVCLAIELGLLTVGERLPDHEHSAKALDVSTMTLRRVLGELAERGVLERRPGRGGGTFVASADPTLWEHDDAVRAFRDRTATVVRLIEQRALIESALCAEAAASVATGSGDADSLGRAALAVDDASVAADWASFHEADQTFHRQLARAAGLDWALGEHQRIADELYGYFVPYPLEYLHESNEQHRALLAAVETGDAVLAAQLAREHVLELKESMFFAEHPLGSRRD